VPAVVGRVIVQVPAAAADFTVTAPEVEPDRSKLPAVVPATPSVSVPVLSDDPVFHVGAPAPPEIRSWPDVPVLANETGAAPAPPPRTRAYCVRAAEDAHVEEELKYGMPPEVPATVNANVPEVVIGEPATEMIPPVNDWATLVTVPRYASVAQLGRPPETTKRCPVVPIGNLLRAFVLLA